jgi:hypothetical protein
MSGFGGKCMLEIDLDFAGSQNAQNSLQELLPSGKHGATTENTKDTLTLLLKNGFDGVLVEGWNVGWEDWFGNWKEEVLISLLRILISIYCYGLRQNQKNVNKMIMHHETSGSVANYERHLDRAMDVMIKYDYPAVKNGLWVK